MDKKLVVALAVFFEATIASADIAPIINTNNQAYIDGLLGNRKLNYSANQPGDVGIPLLSAMQKSKHSCKPLAQ